MNPKDASSPIVQEINALRRVTSELGEALEQLRARLGPVLCTDTKPVEGAAPALESAGTSGLALAVRDATNQLVTYGREITNMLSRLEV